jgi:hypothetical protein
MNDRLFIIDQPPRPSNDDVNPDQDVNVIATIADLGPKGDRQASLIAAAPELLRTLIRLCEVCRIPDIEIHVRGHLALADAVIAKATGQET